MSILMRISIDLRIEITLCDLPSMSESTSSNLIEDVENVQKIDFQNQK